MEDAGEMTQIGVPERVAANEYYNSVISLGASPEQVYRKSHLVPFGEFIPLRPVLGWIVSVLAIPLQDFSLIVIQLSQIAHFALLITQRLLSD